MYVAFIITSFIMEEENRLVSECPPPPAYYKRFKSASDASNQQKIEPPNVPAAHSNFNPSQQYGSIIVKNLPPSANYDPNKDYKVELLRALDEIVEKSLEMFQSASSLQNISYELKFAEFNASILSFNQLLNEYREHEAHCNLCALSERKLQEIVELRDKMKKTLLSPS